MWSLKNPSAITARQIENLIIMSEESNDIITKIALGILSRVGSLTFFPAALAYEIILKRVPKLASSIPSLLLGSASVNNQFEKQLGKMIDHSLCFLSFPLGVYSPDVISGFRLKLPASEKVIPFGVEEIFGKEVDPIAYPKNIQDVQELVRNAKAHNKQISIIGAGMSQGTQTVPAEKKHLVIHTKFLNHVEIDAENNIARVGSGATWEQVQIAANKAGKSVIVKQASDVFSIGGSIGINCHGWAHEVGSISKTVKSMIIVDGNGNIQSLTPEDELFGCMFGTLGYFGVICKVELSIDNNEYLVQQTKTIPPENFIQEYLDNIKNADIPLFGGRLSLNTSGGAYFSYVQMLSYARSKEKTSEAGYSLNTRLIVSNFNPELKWGNRIEQIFLQTFGHLPKFVQSILLRYFWQLECDNMNKKIISTKNETLHPPINALTIFHASNLHAQWLQEYFIKAENLPSFLNYFGKLLKDNEVSVINATIRPTPKDDISILPYAEKDRYGVVICFYQRKTNKAITQTRKWIKEVNQYLMESGDVFYQAYMPYATKEQFVKCYGLEKIQNLRQLKLKYDPEHRFGSSYTRKYFQ